MTTTTLCPIEDHDPDRHRGPAEQDPNHHRDPAAQDSAVNHGTTGASTSENAGATRAADPATSRGASMGAGPVEAGSLPFAPDVAPPVGTLERRVLDVLWKTRQAHTARSMVQALVAAGGQQPAYTTVATVLGHLVDKALVDRELISGVWSYTAALTGCQFSAAHMVRALGETNDRRRCLTRFAGMLNAEEAVYLKSLL